MNLSDIEGGLLDGRTKGMPGGLPPFALSTIAAKHWNVLAEDLTLPLCVLHQSALDHNARWMRAFLGMSNAVIAPHGKTTMSPQLFRRQIDDGAWAITVANAQQAQVARYYGFQRVVLANQLVGRQFIRFVLDELKRDPGFEFFCLVDSVAGVEAVARAARENPAGRPIQVLLEGGMAGGRTGVRDVETAKAVARAVKAAAPHLALRGVEGFEGIISSKVPAEAVQRVNAFLDFLVAIAVACEAEALFAPGPIILSAGGSAYYDLVVERFNRAGLKGRTMVLTRSGCYLTHDSELYAARFAELTQRSPHLHNLGEGPRPALEVWAYVQSRPEPTKAFATMGKRDVSYDPIWPSPQKWYRPSTGDRKPLPLAGHKCVNLNDQHAFLDVPADSPLQVGDMIGFGISHPCLTFDKWQVICVVDDNYDVVGAVKTFF